MRLASFRRFWAVAARRDSSRAPQRPRRRRHHARRLARVLRLAPRDATIQACFLVSTPSWWELKPRSACQPGRGASMIQALLGPTGCWRSPDRGSTPTDSRFLRRKMRADRRAGRRLPSGLGSSGAARPTFRLWAAPSSNCRDPALDGLTPFNTAWSAAGAPATLRRMASLAAQPGLADGDGGDPVRRDRGRVVFEDGEVGVFSRR